ncbi:Transcriptional regulator, contains XRE-family HTH domain [Pedobacter westerhofensis]|uniref:Transcriptional regulator, contains XRE-family HTH domain n=1 Tax=Pedobacter westerhofensis TaxID=425512 RepID=A0A521FLS9_9SPHI|nr:helix-turn-helix transcriptional regulator [Pedobacter westerhofensis]SMO97034.1 Transcriptional regulator, contains XRE-family HTH domain [Pedobacter westerhofensis]
MINYFITEFVGRRLRALRLNSGFTEREICKKLQMKAGKFSQLENGLTGIPLWRLMEIAEFFEIGIHELLIRDGNSGGPELTAELESLARMNIRQAEEIARLQRKVMELYCSLQPHCMTAKSR